MKNLFIASIMSLLSLSTFCLAAAPQESPFDPENSDYVKWGPVLPDDDLMPSQEQLNLVKEWTEVAFGGQKPAVSDQEVSIFVERQDFNILRMNESCMGNPLKIQNELFATGLGTHANSRLVVRFPEAVESFSAMVGVDNNSSTNGNAGSVQFAIEVAGKELLRSKTQKGSDPAIPFEVKFEKPVSEFVLVVDTTADGPSCDQADWANAVATSQSGQRYILGNVVKTPLRAEFPFSFKYNGISSRDFLANWKFNVEKIDDLNSIYSWTDPETKLVVSAKVRRFGKLAGVDWVLNFKNTGNENSGLIEDVQVLDASFDIGLENAPIAIHTLTGDFCNDNTWLPIIHPLEAQKSKTFAPTNGRPSNGVFPFWNVVRSEISDDEPTEGIFIAVGWSGQWNATFEHPSHYQTAVRAGMEKISTVLYPQEEIRSPRILLMPWKSDRLSAQVLFRRLLMFEYAPKMDNGLPMKMETIGQCFDRYYRKREGWEKYDGQVEFAKRLKAAGCTAYWFDAAWFPVGFPNGVGNWFSDTKNFPGGLEQLGQTIQDLGLKFVLWFEPERVAPNTEIATKYPQYVFGGEKGGLYKLNDPEARKHLTELLLKRIKDYKVGVYRNDFNIDPLSFWRANDAEDRQGMTEIRYVEGHYEMWNRFRSENPGLWIDNCASGGRRIDLETTSIAVPLWRSDTCCWPGHPEWDQNQTLGLAQYLPLFSCSSWDPSPYTFRSAANPGCILQYNFLDDDYDPVMTKKSVDEAKAYQKFWYGDFYPLSDVVPGKAAITAWQLHRSDLNAGVVYVFRQEKSPYIGRSFDLRAIDPDANYRINIKRGYEIEKSLEMTGAELAEYPILMNEKKSTIVIEYQKQQ
ncbi:MAG: NPCBM/NEW2 domain-containing protein [Planctomycetia bacterium]|nr:NPCBM/NEW2 domain-containing protein [Planctomycetia bacterium]